MDQRTDFRQWRRHLVNISLATVRGWPARGTGSCRFVSIEGSVSVEQRNRRSRRSPQARAPRKVSVASLGRRPCLGGEHVWIDKHTDVSVGADGCVSQGAYLCTGNDDWSDPAFGLKVKPISVGSGAWVGAKAVVCPGVVFEEWAVVAAGSVGARSVPAFEIHAGTPVAFSNKESCGSHLPILFERASQARTLSTFRTSMPNAITVRNLCCKRDVRLAIQSLRSLQMHSAEPIRLMIHEDGSFDSRDCELFEVT